MVWYWATRNADEEAREKFESDLWQPPDGVEGEGIWSAESEMDAFNSLKASLGV